MVWSNSFVEIQSILERNAREHHASFVLFTGDIPLPTEDEVMAKVQEIMETYGSPSGVTQEMARNKIVYDKIQESQYSFRIMTLDGVDEDTDGMRKRVFDEAAGKYVIDPQYDGEDEQGFRVYQGFKYGDMPPSFVLGDSLTYSQRGTETHVDFGKILDLDVEYPESEHYPDSPMQKWVRRIRQTFLDR